MDLAQRMADKDSLIRCARLPWTVIEYGTEDGWAIKDSAGNLVAYSGLHHPDPKRAMMFLAKLANESPCTDGACRFLAYWTGTDEPSS